MLSQDLVQALDAAVFAQNNLDFHPDPWQKQVLSGHHKRLLLNCSRQSGKSTTASILALHRAIYYPKSMILLISPSLRQSSELFRKVTDRLNLLKTKPEKTEDNRLSLTLKNGSRIVSLPSSEVTIRGFSGATLIIEDEAARVPDELYYAIRPMLATVKGRLILMSTPFGKRAHFYDAWENGGNLWERISIPASACPRISKEFLEEERGTLGEWWFSQEYECQFIQTTDQVFDYNTVMKAISNDVKPLFEGGIS